MCLHMEQIRNTWMHGVPYLHVGHGDSVDHVVAGVLDLLEEVVECEHHDPRLSLSTKHRVRLTST